MTRAASHYPPRLTPSRAASTPISDRSATTLRATIQITTRCYTWSKMMDNYGPYGQTDPFLRSIDYGYSSADYTNLIHFSAVWQVPNHGTTALSRGLMNGWELTSLATWESGFPFEITSGVDNSFSGVGLDRADFVGTNISQAKLDPGRPHGQLIQEYFNPTVFAPNAIGTFGDSGKNIIRGPGMFSTDFGVLKNTPITERASVQFRAEFFNFFNNVNFNMPDNSIADSTVGQITSAGNPRILQFALKLIF